MPAKNRLDSGRLKEMAGKERRLIEWALNERMSEGVSWKCLVGPYREM